MQSDGLIFVFVNPIMSLFMLLSSLTISSPCFESDLTLWTKTGNVPSGKEFLFIMEHQSFCFRRSYCSNASLFTFIANFPFTIIIKFLPD